MFRSVEMPVAWEDKIKKKKAGEIGFADPYPWYHGRHPCHDWQVREFPKKILPGNVSKATRREVMIRDILMDREVPEQEEFDKLVQVFAQRSRQKHKWLAVQRREFLRRAKRWAGEMLLQDMQPCDKSVRLILLGCEATGDISGAQWWFGWMERYGRAVGRMEYNSVIGALATEGQPMEATKWLNRMSEAGVKPDARSYAGVIEAWEKIGNRRQMLNTLVEMQQAERDGELADSRWRSDYQMPYVAMAGTYSKVGDAARAVSLLKVTQVKQVPTNWEVHRVRLEAHLKTTPMRRSEEDIEAALQDFLSAYADSKKAPKITEEMSINLQESLQERFDEILEENGLTVDSLSPELHGVEELPQWRMACAAWAIRKKAHGIRAIRPQNQDEQFIRKRMKQMQGPKFGETPSGRYRIPNEAGLPEWMTVPEPIRYG